MKVINRKVKLLTQILGEPRFKPEAKLREINYIMRTPVDGGTLIHNTFTGEIIFAGEGEDVTEYLKRNWYYVEEGFDERELVKQTREIYKLVFQSKRDGISSYTILPTSDCNARCFYCYELGCEKMVMDEKTAHDVASYIAAHLPTRFEEDELAPGDDSGLFKDDKKLRITWFGGEPLYNYSAIDTICSDLAKRGVDYACSMISNGYLFDDTLVAKAVSLWKLEKIQITLDGTREVYNERKAYIYEGDAFERVTGNIKRLLDADVKVRIRLNLDEDNFDDLCRLCDELSERFATYENFSIYSHLLFQIINEGDTERLTSLYEKRAALGKHTKSNDRVRASRRMHFSYSYCMADNPFCEVILPDGRLQSCEHFNENVCWGSIYTGETKLTAKMPDDNGSEVAPLEYWSQMHEDIPECEKCVHYPSCLRSKHCADDKCGACLEIEREYRTHLLRREAQYIYEKALKAEQNAKC